MSAISHYNAFDSSNVAWINEMISMETEGQISPEAVQTNYSRLVSADAIKGCAPMESEVPA